MSQLANIHQQVVPVRTAHALPPGQCDILFPKLPAQQIFQHLRVSTSIQQSHHRAKKSSRNLDEDGSENLKPGDPEDSYLFVYVLYIQPEINEEVRRKGQFLPYLSSGIHVR
jgi:hypothetical protein